ncbi:MAG: tripartite tricarboxylate transporter permease, partial [Deltaproteobacteria bacterium]
GSGTTAILLAALILWGLKPGPLMIQDNPQLFWGLVASMYIGNVILIILNLPLVGLFINLLRVPFRILFPVILLVCLVGTYAVNASVAELLILLVSGVLGYLFRKLDFDIAPFILAMIIGPTLEMTFRQSLMRSGGDFSIFWKSPISLVLLALSGVLLMWNVYRALRPQRTSWEKALEEGE